MKNKEIFLTISTIRLFLDIALIYLIFSLAYWVRFTVKIIPVIKEMQPFYIYREAIPFVIIIWLVIFFQQNMYLLKRSYLSATDELVRTAKAVTMGTIIIMAATFLYREFSYSRVLIAYAWLLGFIFIFSAHEFLKYLENMLIKRYSRQNKILIIGDGKVANSLKEALERCHSEYFQYKEQLNYEKLKEVFQRKEISEVIMARFPIVYQDVLSITKICDENDVQLRLIPDLLELRMGELIMDSYFGMPVMQIKPTSLHAINFFIKKTIDITFAISFLIIFFVPLLLICLFIKLDSPGPILHIQERMGYKGRTFPFYKFRTMVMNAEEIFKGMKPLNYRKKAIFKIKDDPRTTRVGQILRKYSLDEIPQLFNILRGEMSLVGPRPQVLRETEYYDELAKRRLHVLPGITGLWQVSGRSDLTFEEMIKLDTYYIENWSLGLDLKIILKTIPVIFFKKGAY